MEFRVLGPVEVVEGSRSLTLGGAKQRALLAVLVLNANRVVSTERLIDALWGERAPDGAAHTIQVFVSQLRKALRADGERLHEDPLVTQGSGYVLQTTPEQVDLHMFEAMVEEGRKALADGDPGRASALLRDALELWRGPALAGLEGEPFAHLYVARIEDMRLAAIEDRIEADLALGRHGELVGELGALVSEFPLRERLRGQLMLALYRSGRQAEALSAYRDARQMLAEELGIDPTPDLQRLEGAILRQDSDLDLVLAPSRPAPAAAQAPRELRRPTRRGWLVGGGAMFLVALAVASLVIVATADSSTTPPSSVAPNSVGRIDGTARELVAAIPTTGTAPTALAWADGSLWVANTVSRTVARIDPDTNRVVQTVPSAGAPTDVAAGEGAIWVLNGLDGTVVAIDPSSNEASEPIEVHPGAAGIAVGGGAVWVTNRVEATVTRIDPRTWETVPFSVGAAGAVSPEAIAVDDDKIWVADGLNPIVLEIDPESEKVVHTPALRAIPTDLAVGGDGSLWVTSYEADLVSILDPSTLNVTTIPLGRGPMGIAAEGSAVWVAESLEGAVAEIDSTSRQVFEIPVGGTTDDVAIGNGSVWVSVHV